MRLGSAGRRETGFQIPISDGVWSRHPTKGCTDDHRATSQPTPRRQRAISKSTKAFIDVARIVACSRGNIGNAKALVHDNRIRLAPVVKQIFDTYHAVYSFRRLTLPPARKRQSLPARRSDTGWALPLAEYQTLASSFLEFVWQTTAPSTRCCRRCAAFHSERELALQLSGVSGTTVPQAISEADLQSFL